MKLKFNDKKFILKILGYQYSKKKSVYNSDANWLKCKVILKSKKFKYKLKDSFINIDDIITLRKWFNDLMYDNIKKDYFNLENTLFIELKEILGVNLIKVILNTGYEEHTVTFKKDNKQICGCIFYLDCIIDKFPKRDIEHE